MENNLTLEHIQHYPKGKNGIKVKFNDDGRRELYDLDQDTSHLQGVFYIKSIDYDLQVCQLASIENEDYAVDEANIDWLLPIFLPLDCLTKEIEVDGDKFVPAMKLIELAIEQGYYKQKFVKGHECFDYKIITKPFGKVLKCTEADEWILYLSFSDMKRSPYWVIQQLFKWHFDVFSLIEKGKAININTINLK